MKLIGTCVICSRPSMFTCSACGRPVCGECYDKELRVCKACKGRTVPDLPKRFGEDDNPNDKLLF